MMNTGSGTAIAVPPCESGGKTMKRVLTIQDLSCAGRCSLTEAIPVLSLCGLETVALPTAVLSTHTGGLGEPFRMDLTENLSAMAAHWQEQKIGFDGILTGYLNSPRQVGIILEILKISGNPGCVRVVDPVMGDHGKLYRGFGPEFIGEMRKLCAAADLIVPNLTEACLLTGTEYPARPDRDFAEELVRRLADAGYGKVVLTGISFRENVTGVMALEDGKLTAYEHPRFPRAFHGTGDLYAAALTGALMNRRNTEDAARIAADFTLLCLKDTPDDADPRFGTHFETALPALTELLRS